MATIAVGAPPAQQAPEAQPRASWLSERGPAQFIAAIAAVLGLWIVLFFFLRGRNTLALAPADTKPLHVWLSDLQTRVGEGRSELGVGRDPANDRDLPRACLLCSLPHSLDERLHDRPLIRGREVCPLPIIAKQSFLQTLSHGLSQSRQSVFK